MSRKAHPVEELIRFVRSPDGTVVPDLKRRLPGRGVWVEALKTSVEEAVKRKVFARGFKTETGVPPGLAADVEALLERGALEMLSLANKAGRVVTGFGKVEASLDRNDVAMILHADDAARDGRRKLAQAARRGTGGGEVRVLGLFSSQQLDLALGRENVVHAALLADPVSDAFIARALLLARYRDGASGRPAETDQE